jgi:heterodisulfide reductase subunit B
VRAASSPDREEEVDNSENSNDESVVRIPYYPGCTLKTTSRNFEYSAIAAAKALGIEMVELPRWNCCGTVFSLTEDDLIHHVAPVRNLIRVQEMNASATVKNEKRLITICPMCFNTLKRANLRVKANADELQKINDFMYLEEDYEGEVQVVHILEVLAEADPEKIKEEVTNPLKGLRVAPYYGCMILRPTEVAIDDPEDPRIQDKLLELLGVEVIDNPYKKVCCGSYHTVQEKYVIAELAYDILTHAQKNGAEAITTCCPLCAYNLDDRQREVKERHPEFEEIPVFCLSQLMVLAFGIQEKCCDFDEHYVDPRPLLEEKNLLKGKKAVSNKKQLRTGAKP